MRNTQVGESRRSSSCDSNVSRPSGLRRSSSAWRESRPSDSIKAKVGAALTLTALLVSGCAPSPVPVLHPVEIPSGPVLTQDQTYQLLDHVTIILNAASTARDPAQLSERLTGPALAIRTSQLQVAQIRDDDSQVTDIPDTYQQLIVPTTENWPRTLFAITAVTGQLQPPRLLALVQDTARDRYRLWGWVQLQPGVTMPAFNDPRVGSAEVAADDSAELLMSPAEAIRQYADLLVHQNESEYAPNFQPLEDDQLRSLLAGLREAQETALLGERIEGTYYFDAVPAEGVAVKAVRSAEGGAMVMGEIHTSERLTAMEGAVLRPSTLTAQALLEGQEFTNLLTASYVDVIALYVPPADSGEVVRLLGYSHIQTGASVADPEPEEPAEEPEPEG